MEARRLPGAAPGAGAAAVRAWSVAEPAVRLWLQGGAAAGWLQAVLARRLASGARASEGVARGRRRTWGATLTVQLDSADARVTSPRSRRAEL
jgi:hypothetical protein